ncbi:MAG: PASTA domain-containing protein [Elusimicrobiaceae bacterium]|nr:PASTA domain-containing protein [Elusimicrobiaceae bacterium]
MQDTESNEILEGKRSPTVKILKAISALILVIAFLGTIAFFSFNWAFSALVHTRAERTVPDLTNKNVDTALDLLANVNLAMRKAGEEYQPDIPAGSVIRQLPPAGILVREGKVIRVWVSQGKESVEVPDVTSMPLRDAEFTLRQANLEIGKTDTAYSVEIAKGNIISQTPAPLALVVKGEKVDLVVSNGAPNSGVTLVPDFRHKKFAEASNWASNNNIEVIVREDPASFFPSGTVLSQKPLADEEIKTGETLELLISSNKEVMGEKTHRIHYELPQGKNDNRVRIILIDNLGEKEIINELKQAGSKIDLNVPYGGEATVRIYVDGILVRQKELK